jgi:penicillin-binding protein 1A
MHIFVSVLRFSGWLTIIVAASIVLLGSAFFLALAPTLPDVEQLRDIQLQTPLRIFTRDEKLIAEFGEQRRKPVAIDNVPEIMVNAFLAAEDSRFYEHPGVDIKGLSRAVVELVTTGSIQSGGSTITMQVAKNYFLSQEKTFSRKFNEILLAFKIEQEMSKNEILELYFNKIYLGNRAYGIEAAANVYYGKTLVELNLAQTAMIAGLPKAPSRYNPLASPARALLRRNWILDRMRELQMIDEAEHTAAVNAPVSAKYYGTQPEVDAPFLAEMARLEILELLGPEAYTGGYRAYLTANSVLQNAADSSLKEGLIRYSKRHGYRGPVATLAGEDTEEFRAAVLSRLSNTPSNSKLTAAWIFAVNDAEKVAHALMSNGTETEIPFSSMLWANRYHNPDTQGSRPEKVSDVLSPGDIVYVELKDGIAHLSQKPVVQGALVSLNAKTGDILALVGGFDFYMSKFNRATQAKRQPGSNFKPFIYLAGLEDGLTAASLFNDAPVVFDDAGLESAWRPENSSGQFYGPTRLREALYLSRNLVSIRLLQRLGIDKAITFLDNAGFSRNQLPRSLSLALGTGTFTPMEIARGYAILANGGSRVYPHILDRVTDHEGRVLYRYSHTEHKHLAPSEDCQECTATMLEQQHLEQQSTSETEVLAGKSQAINGSQEANPNDRIADPRTVIHTQ